ncbi:Esterase/lipase/thioesterase [Termitomyces sp. T32_za158]|nr:Esterase/lipase/thioesterase [Termitomyces sp. T32_za158]
MGDIVCLNFVVSRLRNSDASRPASNPITSATDPTIACNDDGSSGALQLTANVVAGSAITAYWNAVWPHNIGPMLTYLAQCPGSTCTGVNAETLKWFKIDEAGLISGTVYSGTWGSGEMIAQNSSWTTTIPKTVPSGNYLIRFETIALHSLPAQFYPECAQINISGGGSLAPTADQLVTFPGGYSNSDPGSNDIRTFYNLASHDHIPHKLVPDIDANKRYRTSIWSMWRNWMDRRDCLVSLF